MEPVNRVDDRSCRNVLSAGRRCIKFPTRKGGMEASSWQYIEESTFVDAEWLGDEEDERNVENAGSIPPGRGSASNSRDDDHHSITTSQDMNNGDINTQQSVVRTPSPSLLLKLKLRAQSPSFCTRSILPASLAYGTPMTLLPCAYLGLSQIPTSIFTSLKVE